MKLLDPNGPVFRFLSRIGDLIILNILCILCSLPILTAGASITAMYYVTLRMHRGQDSGVVRDFFHSFRQNLKQSTILHILLTSGTILLALDLYILWTLWEFDLVFRVLLVIMAILAFFYVGICLFTYPLLAQFNNTVLGFLKNAFFMSMKHRSYTIAIVLVTLAPWLIGLYVPYALEWLLIIYLFIGFSSVAFFLSRYFATIFDKYISADEC